MIPPSADDERDGPENAALSVVAGFAEACNLKVKVVLHSEARAVLDILPEALPVEDLNAFKPLIRKLHEDLVQQLAEAAQSASQAPVPEMVARPDVGGLPLLPHIDELKERFIGRQRWLEDYYSALDGLKDRWTRSMPGGRKPVQLFWYHGLGGMGKTTLVRKAMVETGERYPQCRIAYWEWDKPVWRKPLDREAETSEDVFIAVAYRLAQLYGVEALDPYWRVESRIGSASGQERRAKSRFHTEYNEWLVKGQVSSPLRAALDALRIPKSRRDLSENDRSSLFRRWIDEGGFEFDDREASLDDARLRHEALLSCLTKLSEQAPLLLVFDTCEVLSAPAEQALRGLLAELCDRRKPVLVLIASRLAPDVGAVPGVKDTWRDSLGDDRLKIERFDDLTLTTTEIEDYLRRYVPALEKPEEVAPRLQRITLGVPLAVRVLVEMEGGTSLLRNEAGAWSETDSDALSRENALYRLYEELASRFLFHVHEEEDLHAILALAITIDADKETLVSFWGGRAAWSERLRGLARRFSLLNGGDLHPVVRGHLRRSLRAGKYRAETEQLAAALLERLPAAGEDPPFDDRHFQQKLGRINLQTWTRPDPSPLDLAPGSAMAMAHGQRLDPWILLAAEIAEASEQSPGRSFLLELQQIISMQGRSLSFADFFPRYRWSATLSSEQVEACFGWLGAAEKQVAWSGHETTSLRIMRALLARSAPNALRRFETALGDAAPGAIPLVSRIGEALFDLADAARLKSPRSADIETSLRLAVRIAHQPSSAHAALGSYFRLNRRYTEACDHYTAAFELEPKNPSHPINIANVYRLRKQYDKADEWVGKTLTVQDDYAWAYSQRGLIELDRKHYEAAAAATEKAREIDPGEPAFASNLADIYRAQRRFDKAGELVEAALSIQADDPMAHYERGLIAADQKHYSDAVAAFEEAHGLDPNEPAYPNSLADTHRLLRKYDEAADWVAKTLSIQADYASGHNQRGLIARDRKQYGEAVAAFLKAHELDTAEPAFANNVANICRLQRQYDQAAKWVENAFSIQSDYVWAHNQRGLIARDRQRYDEAVSAFRKAHELDPAEPAFAYNVADGCRLQRQYGDATVWVDKALSIQADYAAAHNQRGFIARDRQQYDEAIDAFVKATDLDPNEPAYPNDVADSCRLVRQYDKAAEWVEKSLSIQPDFPWAYNQRGLIARDRKQYGEAVAAFQKAHELEPTEPSFANNVANISRLQKQYGQAAAWVEKAFSIQSDYPWAYNQRGLLARDRQQYGEAVGAFGKAHELDPTEPAFANNLADACRLQRQYDQAAGWVEKAFSIQSDYPWAHNQRGLIARDRQRYGEAVGAFRKAHELEPTEPSFANNVADTCRLQRQYEQAAAWVETAFSIQSDYPWAHSQRGLIASDRKLYDEAIVAFEKAHELDPAEPVHLNNVANTYRLRKDYDKALEWVRKTLLARVDYAWAYNQRGLIAQDQQQHATAILDLKKAFDLYPLEADFAYNVGWSLLEELNYADSEFWARQAIGLNGEHVGARNLLGAIAFSLRRWAEAERIFRDLTASEPSETVLPCNVAVVCMRLARFSEALEQISVALRIDADDSTANQLLAVLQELEGNPEAGDRAGRAVGLSENFSALLVFALTRLSTDAPDPLAALTTALDKASKLDREQDFDYVIYALRGLEAIHGSAPVRAAVRATVSPVWELLRQAAAHCEQPDARLEDTRVAAIVSALRSPLPPKEQLLAAWASDSSALSSAAT